MVAVRPGRAEDVDEVVAMWDNLTRADAPPARERWSLAGDAVAVWRRHLSAHFLGGEGALFVAEDEARDELAGFITVEERRVSPLFPVGRVGRIDAIFVRPAYQGRGVGRALVEAAERWLTDQGYDAIEVKTFFGNLASRALWTRLGYEPTVVVFEKASRPTSREAQASTPAPSGSRSGGGSGSR